MAPIHAKNLIDAFPYIMQIPTELESLLYAGMRPNFCIERKNADTAYVYVDSGLVVIVAADTPIKGIYQADADLQRIIIDTERMNGIYGSSIARDKLTSEAMRLIQIKQYNS